jgi:molecular chaperone DnaK (HSP70)
MARIKTPSGKLIDRWTQSTVYYLFVPIMQRFENNATRRYITSIIRELAVELHVTREQLGIIASPRAVMYFGGVWSAVSFDSIKTLATKGTDIIFVEKLDIVEVFTEYADKYGIALVNSQGHLTEYGKDLVKETKKTGGHVVIFTDYDASGIKIVKDIPTEIPRLGVDQEMLDHFGLDKNDDSIRLLKPPPENQINPIREVVEKARESYGDKRFENIDLEFLEKYKVEIDAVLAAVGSERLWQYLMDKIKKLFPKRDYNKAISTEVDLSAHYPTAIRNLNAYIKSCAESLTSREKEKIKAELKDVEGFIDVEEKREEIDKRLGKLLEDDEHLKDIASKVDEMVKKVGYGKPNEEND